jgi:transcriptional regulator with XRE-family HTH domain
VTSTLAERLRIARVQAGLSQGQVAKLLDMHRPTISEIEAGRRSVKVDELTQFAETYGVSVTWLTATTAEEEVDPRIALAARELSALDPGDLDKALRFLGTLRASKGKRR